MKSLTLTRLATAGALCASAAALAGMPAADYDTAQESIAREHRLAMAACEPMAAEARAICMAKAKDKERSAIAKLGAARKPADASRTEVPKDAAAAKRDADFAFDKEKCSAYVGSVKQACVSDAKARFDKS